MPIFPSLDQRVLESEIMDDPGLDSAEHARALKALGRVHVLSGTEGRLWRAIDKLAKQANLKQLSIMDVGCGDARLLRQLYKKSKANGIELQLHGCDFSPRALEMARDASERAGIPISLHAVDITQDTLPEAVDVVFCSLFLHHFADDQVVKILESFRDAAKRLIVVEDLLRSKVGYGLCWLGTRVLTRSRVVHVDGLLSVRAAFTPAELRLLLTGAGLPEAHLERCWPARAWIVAQVHSPGLCSVERVAHAAE